MNAKIVAIVAGLAGVAIGYAQADLPNPYRTVESWFKLPDGRMWGSTSAVEVDRDGNLWVAERCGANSCAGSNLPSILKFDASGKLLKSFGEGMFVFPHGIYVDPQGNIWVTDGQGKDGKGQQVFKFNPDGKVLMTLGKAGVAGDGLDTFNQPSDVIVAANGDIFVADGHGGNTNARVVKFSKDGKFIKAWGKKGTGPGDFETPHGFAMDSRGRLFVADRGNNRVEIFDQNGTFLDQWTAFGQPSGLYIDADDRLYVAAIGDKSGLVIGSAKTGTVDQLLPIPSKDLNGPHLVTADRRGTIYVADLLASDLRKFVRDAR